jgi:micrococcal nuclease
MTKRIWWSALPSWLTVGFAVAFVAALAIFLARAAFAGDESIGTSSLEQSLYHYRAVVTEVHDGDTVTVDLDLGFHVWKRGEKIRLAHIDAPELHGATKAEGKAAGDFLRELLLNKNVIIQTIKSPNGSDKQEKYGRYLGVIWLDGVNVNDELVTKGYAVYREF